MTRRPAIVVVAAAVCCCLATAPAGARVTVGSKAFPESWVLGEALASAMRSNGVTEVTHRSNLGGTEIVFQALRSGEVDVYPDYTGTIDEVVLHSPRALSPAERRAALAPLGLDVSDAIGFNDGYALATTREVAARLGLRAISDLARHPEARLGLTHEFLGRPDGYPGLARHYGLSLPRVTGIQHELAYGALASGQIDVTDIYTTDAQILSLGLVMLADDRSFFPRYDAVWLFRRDLATREPSGLATLQRLTGVIDEPTMIRANARVVLGHQSFQQSADSLLAEALGGTHGDVRGPSVLGSVMRNSAVHLTLVAISLVLAIVVGLPLGVLATRSRALATGILSAAGLLQTIPSLALLAFLIPLLGIGARPALVALFLYGLLPIVRNTYVGLTTIPAPLAESATVLGLTPATRLFRVELPMASPSIMAGIKTSAVINVGTATLAALIGAGGLGEPILSGIQLRQNSLILQGAVPAALLALLVQGVFDRLEALVVPRALRGDNQSESRNPARESQDETWSTPEAT